MNSPEIIRSRLLDTQRNWRGDFGKHNPEIRCGQRKVVATNTKKTQLLKNSREKGDQQSSDGKAKFEKQQEHSQRRFRVVAVLKNRAVQMQGYFDKWTKCATQENESNESVERLGSPSGHALVRVDVLHKGVKHLCSLAVS